MDLILWRHADAADGRPDAGRTLTPLGEQQARRVAAWLGPRLPSDCRIIASPAKRTQQTAAALGLPFDTSDAVGTDTRVDDLLAAVAWTQPGTTLVVGHQPTLGQTAALLLTGMEFDWHFAKGAVWWLRYTEGSTLLRAVLDPQLA
jgi:phosphohistidine phosphatase